MHEVVSHGRTRPWSMLRVCFALVTLLLAFDASALRKVDPGKTPTLKPDEGLLVVSVGSNN